MGARRGPSPLTSGLLTIIALLLVAAGLAVPLGAAPAPGASRTNEAPETDPVGLGGMAAPPVLASERPSLMRAIEVSAVRAVGVSPRAEPQWALARLGRRPAPHRASLPLFLRHCSLLS